MSTLLLLNGPNLNLLGSREPELYGSTTLADVEAMCTQVCAAAGHTLEAFQSNHEGALIDQIIGTNFFYIITAIAFFFPVLSATIRRLHDTGKAGWWWWIQIIPIIGFIVMLVFLCTQSDEGKNKYGPDPKGGVSEPAGA